MHPTSFALDALRQAYQAGKSTPTETVKQCFDRIDASGGLPPIWISLVDREAALSRAHELEQSASSLALPLYGIPFAVKDNMDVAGMQTTAACPDYAYTPATTATVIRKLEQAGAILIGKTNLDQFATGLVGVRSPYGTCSSVFDPEYISGGSSSGSAVAVAKGLVSFSLGTDTAGSGRVPAALNNLVGLKPTRGLLSAAGVVPACRTLDCVSIFAASSADANTVFEAARGFDSADAFSRTPASGAGAAPWTSGPFRFGVPSASQLNFFGEPDGPGLFAAAVKNLESLGGESIEIDFAPFRAAADLLYSGPWVAERLAAISAFMDDHEDKMHPVVGRIISGGRRYSATETFRAIYRLQELKAETAPVWKQIDFFLLPTVGRTYKIAEVEADPVQLNTNLGYYTNFVNLLDLAAVATPAGFAQNGLPFGVTLVGPAFTDTALLSMAGKLHQNYDATAPLTISTKCPPGCVAVTVVGAHLSGQSLNGQLTSRGARLMSATRTDPHYRLYALANTNPPKPGLQRDPSFSGAGIEVEVWAIPENEFGSFVASVPAPLGIGTVSLADGTTAKGFICESSALGDAKEITHFGGWRAYLAN
jgi:allophanate hydrolase